MLQIKFTEITPYFKYIHQIAYRKIMANKGAEPEIYKRLQIVVHVVDFEKEDL